MKVILRFITKIMAITLPADLEINTFVSEGDKPCFQIELCCIRFGSKKVYLCLITCYHLIGKGINLVVVKLAVPFDLLTLTSDLEVVNSVPILPKHGTLQVD